MKGQRKRLVKRAVGLLLFCCKSMARPVVAFSRKAAPSRRHHHQSSDRTEPSRPPPAPPHVASSRSASLSSSSADDDDVVGAQRHDLILRGKQAHRSSLASTSPLVWSEASAEEAMNKEPHNIPDETRGSNISFGSANEARLTEEPLSRIRNVQFVSPLLEYGYPPAVQEAEQEILAGKPLLLYLPGFDGTFLSPFLQFPELSTIFDVRSMRVPMEDRSTLDELRDSVIDYLEHECRPAAPSEVSNGTAVSETTTIVNETSTGSQSASRKVSTPKSTATSTLTRPVYIVGESFGGILASIVSLTLIEKSSSTTTIDQGDASNIDLQGLILINAATCYDRSRLALEGPKVASLNPWLYPLGLCRLLPLFWDDYSAAQLLLIFQAKALPSVIDDAYREAYMGRVAFSLPFVIPYMTQGALQWRLREWLEAGCARLAASTSSGLNNDSLPILSRLRLLRILIIAGEKDATLPSIAEAERLASLWPQNSVVYVVEGAGHASTCGSRMDLAALLRFRFPELRPKGRPAKSMDKKTSNPFWFWQPQKTPPVTTSKVHRDNRTAMKPVALNGKGAYFGMEPRYDNAKIGLSPLRYWSKPYYRKYPIKRRP
jgi:pimeloyl-ACP methyl ester carboxylesterase